LGVAQRLVGLRYLVKLLPVPTSLEEEEKEEKEEEEEGSFRRVVCVRNTMIRGAARISKHDKYEIPTLSGWCLTHIRL